MPFFAVSPCGIIALVAVCIFAVSSIPLVLGVCDGNPHQWNRQRRCDQFDSACPEQFVNCSTCEGIGGIASSDLDKDFTPTFCRPIATAEEMEASGMKPIPAILPKTFVNTGFHEVQIFVKRDPFCFAQIPAMVSNGTHCFKRQEGTFNYDATQSSLRIDYMRSETVILPGVNMTEHFYHLPDGTVHPDITKYGVLPTPVCPCIKLGIGPVSPNWASDAQYVGREALGIEFLEDISTRVVDHFVKGPHHVWTDVTSGQVIRMWQPYNGLEIFDPRKWSFDAIPSKAFDLPIQCKLEAKLGCINGEQPSPKQVKGMVQDVVERLSNK